MDDNNTLLVMITEENYGKEKLLDSNNSSCQWLGSNVYSVENSTEIRLEQNMMMTVRDEV